MTDGLRFDLDPPTDAEDERLQKDYEAGDFLALHEAFLRYAPHEVALPDWVIGEVSKLMVKAWVSAGSKGQGKTGGYKVQTNRAIFHMTRHGVAEGYLNARRTAGGPKNSDEAFELASKELRETDYRGTSRQIRDSYNKVVRWRRKRP